MKNIPYSIVDLSNNDHNRIINSINRWLAHGYYSSKFEEEFKNSQI